MRKFVEYHLGEEIRLKLVDGSRLKGDACAVSDDAIVIATRNMDFTDLANGTYEDFCCIAMSSIVWVSVSHQSRGEGDGE